MSYINKNANIVLLFLVVISLTVLVGATVYYQQNFSGLNEEYYSKLSDLQKMEKDLNAKSMILNKTREELVLKAERESEFTEQFTEIRDVKEGLETDKKKLSSQKASLETQLDSAQNTLSEAQAELTHERRRNAELQSINSQLVSQVEYWKDQAGDYAAQAAACSS